MTYQRIKAARAAGTTITAAAFEAALADQEAQVAAAAVEFGRASGAAHAARRLSPFPADDEVVRVRAAVERLGAELRRLSKLAYWRAKLEVEVA